MTSVDAPVQKNRGGRPKGKRAIKARMTVHIDDPRYQALTALAAQSGRSMHSIILSGIDLATGRDNPAA